ncbi:hypothetical protein [Treponema sp.]|uniref:hypothetical protein n=1 Tax=Treponema sp. TaxID=166 RepID=UPI00298D9C07|nr:hypothetical protein [Treponema sp.]MCQ2242261.1 hypothetical protein [Treponema sp.]
MEEKEYIEKLIKLLIHVGAELAFLLVIPRNESLIKYCSQDAVSKILQDQSDSALKSFLNHIPSYEKALQEVSAFEIAALNDFELLSRNMDALTSNIKDIKTLYDKNQLHFKRYEQNPEMQRAMNFLKKIVDGLTKTVGNVVEKKVRI